MKYVFILLLFLSSCISTLTANEYGQNLNNQLIGLNYEQNELPRVTVDSVKVVISEKPYYKPVVANRFEYLPYGETWITEGDGNNNTKYNSQELDKETNFYFYNARHYDPEIARFVTADTVIDGKGSVKGWKFQSQLSTLCYTRNQCNCNRYMYVAGNPIRYKDPTGHAKRTFKKTKGFGSGVFDLAANVAKDSPEIVKKGGQTLIDGAREAHENEEKNLEIIKKHSGYMATIVLGKVLKKQSSGNNRLKAPKLTPIERLTTDKGGFSSSSLGSKRGLGSKVGKVKREGLSNQKKAKHIVTDSNKREFDLNELKGLKHKSGIIRTKRGGGIREVEE